MAEAPRVKRARAEAALARKKLLLSAHALQARVAPSRIASDAVESARERGTALFGTVHDTARRRPRLAAGMAVGLLAFMARRRIARVIHPPKKPKLAVPARHALPRPSGDTE